MLSFFTRANAMMKVQRILSRHGGGIYKRIDENRELLEVLQSEAPELLAKQPWIVGWLEATDEFLMDLEQVAPVAEPQFGPRQSPSGHLFPRAWPTKVLADVPLNTGTTDHD